jgi:hypothetical protein
VSPPTAHSLPRQAKEELEEERAEEEARELEED